MGQKLNYYATPSVLVVFAILLISFASAASPFISPGSSAQCDIVSANPDTVMANQYHDFHFHVINGTNGVLLTKKDVQCIFHMYNSTGEHIYKNFSVNQDDNWDFTVPIDGSLIHNGQLSYIFQCNSTVTGCFYQTALLATPTGNPLASSGESLALVLIVIALAMMFAMAGNAFNPEQWLVKTALMLISLLVMILGIALGQQFISSAANSKLMTTTLIVGVTASSLLFLFLLVKYLKAIVNAIRKARSEKREDIE